MCFIMFTLGFYVKFAYDNAGAQQNLAPKVKPSDKNSITNLWTISQEIRQV